MAPSDSDPVNLNTFRKAKTRAAKKRRADENAVSFGRTKAQKKQERDQARRAAKTLDAHKRDKT